jgi:hypothetical protein
MICAPMIISKLLHSNKIRKNPRDSRSDTTIRIFFSVFNNIVKTRQADCTITIINYNGCCVGIIIIIIIIIITSFAEATVSSDWLRDA